MRILVVGGGGREHALCWALSRTATVFCAPGNPGTRQCATNLPESANDHAGIAAAIRREHVDLTVVGPEAPLAEGLVDHLAAAGLRAFGPTKAAARIEASKAFAKEVMARAGVPTARYNTFSDEAEALRYIEAHEEPMVVKASGLAAGKGAVVCSTRAEACSAASAMFGGRFGAAGKTILVEQFLVGEELSVFALTDGEHISMLPSSQDHKRLGDGDLGPNTGGMGAYAPVSLATEELLRRVASEVIRPTLRELANRGAPYRGVLYAGLMISPDGDLSVVEFNCRFGDPEAQVVLPIIGADLAEDMWSIASGENWSPTAMIAANQTAVATVLAAPGYPDAPEKGAAITLPTELPEHTLLFHAGTEDGDGTLRVSGGRVLCATGLGEDMSAALAASRRLAAAVEFSGKVCRSDIGWREIARARAS
ncbi:MAG: phosphoribosylamine--glycine ligase [Gemmatimonadetes bacterium]|nr:phosphoribosylamine--glycine ligase [Gemmatimonadota bacterium]